MAYMQLNLTEDQYHILSQALSARETHLEAIASSHPHMATALPILRELRQNVGLAYHARVLRGRACR